MESLKDSLLKYLRDFGPDLKFRDRHDALSFLVHIMFLRRGFRHPEDEEGKPQLRLDWNSRDEIVSFPYVLRGSRLTFKIKFVVIGANLLVAFQVDGADIEVPPMELRVSDFVTDVPIRDFENLFHWGALLSLEERVLIEIIRKVVPKEGYEPPSGAGSESRLQTGSVPFPVNDPRSWSPIPRFPFEPDPGEFIPPGVSGWGPSLPGQPSRPYYGDLIGPGHPDFGNARIGDPRGMPGPRFPHPGPPGSRWLPPGPYPSGGFDPGAFHPPQGRGGGFGGGSGFGGGFGGFT